MKIIAILGSPRKKGNTARVLSMFEDKVKSDHEIEILNINEYDVGGCLGCYKCMENNEEPGCVQNDDASILFDKMINADAIVYATPLYCWSFTAQIKPLIDRHFCLVKGYGTTDHMSFVGDKPAALLVTCGGGIEDNCDTIQEIFDRVCNYGKLVSKGSFILPFCTTPEQIGDNGEELAENLAKAIVS